MSLNNVVVFVTVCLGCSMASSISDIKMKYLQYVLECAEQHSVTTEELKELVKQRDLNSDNIKCTLACAYRKTGMTDEEGKLSEEGIKQVAESAYANDPEKMEQVVEFTKTCIHVNDEEIIGEKKECERAALIFKCSVENAGSSVV